LAPNTLKKGEFYAIEVDGAVFFLLNFPLIISVSPNPSSFFLPVTGQGFETQSFVFEIEVKAGPRQGTCVLREIKGEGVLSQLRVECSQWVTDPSSTPIIFRARVGEVPLTLFSVESSFSFSLPSGNYSLYADVSDVTGTIVSVELGQVQVESNGNLTEFLKDSETLFALRGDSDALLRQMNQILLADLSPQDITIVNSLLQGLISVIRNPDFQVVGPFITRAISGLSNLLYSLCIPFLFPLS